MDPLNKRLFQLYTAQIFLESDMTRTVIVTVIDS